jgi:hypothetical protein
VNTYALFSETIYQIISPEGRAGFIVPSGLATDNSTKDFFGELVSKKVLDSFFEFENEGFFQGAGQGHMLRFALTTIVGSAQQIDEMRFLFQGKKIEHLHDPERVFTLSPEDIYRVNPNTLTCPIFQSRYDAEITKKIYQRVPVLIREATSTSPEVNPWGIAFMRMFDMSNDSYLFKTYEDLIKEGYNLTGNHFEKENSVYVPLYEAKMVYLYNHRYGDFSKTNGDRAHVLPSLNAKELSDPDRLPIPFYWLPKKEKNSRLLESNWNKSWLIGWRDVTDARASARTLNVSVLPSEGVNHKLQLMLPKNSGSCPGLLLANLSSLVCDYIARQKVGGLSFPYFIMRQLPIIPPENYSKWDEKFILKRLVQLTYTSIDMRPWALELGFECEPFRFDPEARAVLQAELDAFYAKLYGLSKQELQFVLDPESIRPGYPAETFAVLKRSDVRLYGEYRTRRLVLEAWDRLEAGTLGSDLLDTPVRRKDPLKEYFAHGTPANETEDWWAGVVCDVLLQKGPVDDNNLLLIISTNLSESTSEVSALAQWLEPLSSSRWQQVFNWLRSLLKVPGSQPLSISDPSLLSDVLGDHRTEALAKALISARAEQERKLTDLMSTQTTSSEDLGIAVKKG